MCERQERPSQGHHQRAQSSVQREKRTTKGVASGSTWETGDGPRWALSPCFGNSLGGGCKPWLPSWGADSVALFLFAGIPASGPQGESEIWQKPWNCLSEKGSCHRIVFPTSRRTHLKSQTDTQWHRLVSTARPCLDAMLRGLGGTEGAEAKLSTQTKQSLQTSAELTLSSPGSCKRMTLNPLLPSTLIIPWETS